jgi:hypothetical protein
MPSHWGGKADELSANLRFQHEYREACLLAFTETWLNDRVPAGKWSWPASLWSERTVIWQSQGNITAGASACSSGTSGVNRSCWERLCTPDIELLSVSLQPYYLPCEFPQLFVTVVYIQPKANITKASEMIYLSQKLEYISSDTPTFILGDFNCSTLHKVLSTYHQYVKWHTRNNKTWFVLWDNTKCVVCHYQTSPGDIRPQCGLSQVNLLLPPGMGETYSLKKRTDLEEQQYHSSPGEFWLYHEDSSSDLDELRCFRLM